MLMVRTVSAECSCSMKTKCSPTGRWGMLMSHYIRVSHKKEWHMPTKKKASTTKNAPVVQEPVVPVETPAVEQDAPTDAPSPVVVTLGPNHGRHTFHRMDIQASAQPVTTDFYRCVCGATLALTAETCFSRRQPAVIKVRMRGE